MSGRTEALRAALTLLADGDIDALSRKAVGLIRGHRLSLPADLRPLLRPRGHAPERPVREQALIWMVGPSLRREGAPASQFELATALSRRHEVVVRTASGGAIADDYAETGIDARPSALLHTSAAAPRLYEADLQRLSRCLSDARPDLMIASTIDAFAAVEAAHMAGIPSLWNIRESEPWRERLADRHPAIAARALAALSYPEHIIFVAESSRRAWSSFVPEGRSCVIYNAPPPSLQAPTAEARVAARRRLGAAPDEILVVSVGTLCARKNQIELARALAYLPADRIEGLRIAFVGEASAGDIGPIRSALPREAQARTVFAGELADGPKAIAAADILVNTSRSEAFPRTFLEAAVVGTPIIAAAVDGAVERLVDGVSARLYPPGDYGMLAGHLAALAGDPALRAHLSAGARSALADSWTWPEMIGAYLARIDDALERQPGIAA
jgi:glycosyltransferase involved in cell wall biosynthesis